MAEGSDGCADFASPHFTNHALAAATLLLLALASFLCTFFSRHPLYGSNRGPFVYPFLGSIVQFVRNRERIYDWMTELLRKDASQTVRNVRPGGIEFHITANPDNIEHILRRNFDNYPKGMHFQTVMSDLLGKGIFNADGELWKLQRKVASHEFTTRSLRDFVVDSVKQEVKTRLVPTLDYFCQSRQSFDLQDLLLRFSFDNICQLAFGVDPACLHFSLPAVQFAEAFDEATGIVARRFLAVNPLFWKIKRALNLGSEKRLREALKVVNDFAMNVIQSRRKEIQSESHADLLSRFMTMDHPYAGDGEDPDEFLKDVIVSFLLAGRDTTAAGLSWFFWVLSEHPHVEQRCYDEMQRLLDKRLDSQSTNCSTHQNNQEIRNNEGSCPSFRPIVLFSYDELKQMNYLHAAISESLRLYPPVAVDAKYAAADDVWPDGTVIRRSTRVAYHPYAAGRMESLWGEDCLEFKPERWLKNGEFVPQNPYKFPVFQAGPRICLGKDMAMIQMKYIAAAIIYHFRISIAAPNFRPKYGIYFTMKMDSGLPVTVHSRQSQQNLHIG